MLSTLIVGSVALALLIGSGALWAIFLSLGLRWAKAPIRQTRTIVLATVVVFISQTVVWVLFRLSSSAQTSAALLALCEPLTQIALACFVIARFFRLGGLRSFQAWLPTLVASGTTLSVVVFVVQPFVFEAYVNSSNAMAPTLLGKHWRATCPKCGRPSYVSPADAPLPGPIRVPMICDAFHVTTMRVVVHSIGRADHFVAVKCLAPRRWDIVIFQRPDRPSSLSAMRVVGLPGERIHIEDGTVWADGRRLRLPDSLRGLKYASRVPGADFELWGTPRRPAVLADDEYFVLGDFSIRANDSRLWQQGAAGHNVFAVPASYVRGVVTHIYWPPRRWRVLR